MNEQEEFEFRLRLEQENQIQPENIKQKSESPLKEISKSAVGAITKPITAPFTELTGKDVVGILGGGLTGLTQGVAPALVSAGQVFRSKNKEELLNRLASGSNTFEGMRSGANLVSGNVNQISSGKIPLSPIEMMQNIKYGNTYKDESSAYPQAETPTGKLYQKMAELAGGLLTGKALDSFVKGSFDRKMTRAFDNAVPKIEEEIRSGKKITDKLAAQTSDEARKQFKVANDKLTSDYEEALRANGFFDEKISHGDFNDLAENVIKKVGIDRSKPDLIKPEEKDFLNWVEEKLGQSRKTDDIFGVQRSYAIDGKDLYEKLKSMSGSLGTRIWSAFNEAVATKFPKLQEVRTNFAPRIQDKIIAKKVIKPYMPSGKTNDITTPHRFFTKLTTGSSNESTKRIADSLDRFLGGNYSGKFKDIGNQNRAKEDLLRFVEDLRKEEGNSNNLIRKAIGLAVSAKSGGIVTPLSAKEGFDVITNRGRR